MKNRLTVKQKMFVNEYLKTKNGTAAAMRVYDVKNKNTAKVIASQNLTKTNIMESIEKSLQAQGYSPQDSVRRLVSTAEEGTGKKATAGDQIRADELLLKLSGHLIERKQSFNMNYDLNSMNREQLIETKARYDKLTKKIMDRQSKAD